MIVFYILKMLIELLKSVIFLKFIMGEKLGRFWSIPVCFTGAAIIMSITQWKDADVNIYIYAAVYGLIGILIKSKGKEKLKKLILLIFLVGSLDEITLILMRIMQGFYQIELFSSILSMIILGIIALLKKYLAESCKIKIYRFIQKYIIAFILVAAFGMIMSCVALNAVDYLIEEMRVRIIFRLISCCSIISVMIVITLAIYVDTLNQKLERIVQYEKEMKEKQISYYEELLKREEDTRKYRHDMKNHLLCLQGYLGHDEYEDAKMYIEKLQYGIKFLQKKVYYSGNRTIDVVINNYLGQLSDDVEKRITVQCEKQIQIEDIDLCVIVGNVIQNAVEALQRIQVRDKWIEVSIIQGVENFEVYVANCNEEQYIEKGERTSKKDKRNHGFGLQNVEEVVQKYSGSMECNRDEKMYVTRIRI